MFRPKAKASINSSKPSPSISRPITCQQLFNECCWNELLRTLQQEMKRKLSNERQKLSLLFKSHNKILKTYLQVTWARNYFLQFSKGKWMWILLNKWNVVQKINLESLLHSFILIIWLRCEINLHVFITYCLIWIINYIVKM